MKVVFKREVHCSSRKASLEAIVEMPACPVHLGMKLTLGQGDEKLAVIAKGVNVDVDSGWVEIECVPSDPKEKSFSDEVARHLAAGFKIVDDGGSGEVDAQQKTTGGS